MTDTQYIFTEEEDEPVIEVHKILAWEIEDVVTSMQEEGDARVSINDDMQTKTLKCEHCEKSFSRWSDWARHYMAKHFEPTDDKDQDLIRAAGKSE